MSEQRRWSYFSAKVMSAVVLAGALFLSSVPQIHADDDHAKCQRRIEKAESRLDDAVRHHGERSRRGFAVAGTVIPGRRNAPNYDVQLHI